MISKVVLTLPSALSNSKIINHLKQLFMKTLKLFTVAIALSSTALAQTFKPVEFDLPALGYAKSSDAGSGIVIPLEIRYNINDQISAGLQYQWAFLVNASASNVSVGAVQNFSLVGDYYFNTDDFRPFVGLGVGTYAYGYFGIDTSITAPDVAVSVSKFGLSPRLGFEYKHFRMLAEYNMILGTSDIIIGNVNYNPGYFDLKMALTILGGRKDK